jgi:hypothetical protein
MTKERKDRCGWNVGQTVDRRQDLRHLYHDLPRRRTLRVSKTEPDSQRVVSDEMARTLLSLLPFPGPFLCKLTAPLLTATFQAWRTGWNPLLWIPSQLALGLPGPAGNTCLVGTLEVAVAGGSAPLRRIMLHCLFEAPLERQEASPFLEWSSQRVGAMKAETCGRDRWVLRVLRG